MLSRLGGSELLNSSTIRLRWIRCADSIPDLACMHAPTIIIYSSQPCIFNILFLH